MKWNYRYTQEKSERTAKAIGVVHVGVSAIIVLSSLFAVFYTTNYAFLLLIIPAFALAKIGTTMYSRSKSPDQFTDGQDDSQSIHHYRNKAMDNLVRWEERRMEFTGRPQRKLNYWHWKLMR